jgi:hypothetical protein
MSVSEILNSILILIARGKGNLNVEQCSTSQWFSDGICTLVKHALTSRTTYVFEIAKNSFCPSGGTLADRAVTSLRFSSIWLRTLLLSCNRTIPHYTLNIHRILHETSKLLDNITAKTEKKQDSLE